MLEFRELSVGYGGAPVLRGITFRAERGKVTCLIGPNGCGKTTLLRCAARRLTPIEGKMRLDGRALSAYERKEFARTVAVLPQGRIVPGISVRTLVNHGRFPHLGLSRKLRQQDREIVERAMSDAGVSDWAERDLREMSGGERQRAYLAMALAQDTPLILLDEPTTYLDIGAQFAFLSLIRQISAQGKTVIMVLHDLAQALRYSDALALLSGGTLRFFGAPEALYQSGLLSAVFGVTVHRGGEAYYFTPG